MNNGLQLKAGAIISYLQMGIGILVGLIYTPVMIRLLGQSEYGLYSTVASTISVLSILRLGFNNSYIRYYSKYKNANNDVAIYKLNGVFITLFSVIGVIAFLCGIFLTSNLSIVFATGLSQEEYEIAKVLMLLLTINLSLSFPMSVFSNIITANERFIFLKSLDAIKTVAGPMVTLPLLLMGYGSIAMVGVTLVVSLIVDSIYIYYVIHILHNRFVFSFPEHGLIKDLGAYTFFIALELVVDQVNWNIDKVLLARFKGTAMVAIYSVGYSLYGYYQSFSSAISGVFTPRIHKIVNTTTDPSKQSKELTDLFTRVGRIQFLILSLMLSGVIIFGKFFITRIWAGGAYGESYYVALLLMIPATIALIQNIGIEIQRAEYKHQFRSIVYSLMAIVNFLLSVILCQKYGAIGSALGTAISLVLANGLIMNVYYHKQCNIDILYFWKNIICLAKGLIIPIIIFALYKSVYNTTNIIQFVLEIVIYVIIFCISMWHCGMNKYEKDMIGSIFSRLSKR